MAPAGRTESGPPPIDPTPCTFVNLVVTPPSYSGCGDPDYDRLDTLACSDLGSSPLAGPAFVWIVVTDRDGFPGGIGGIQYGIEYDRVEVTGWSLCTGGSDIPMSGWPASGSGNASTWSRGCRDMAETTTRIGFLSVASADSGVIEVTGDPRIEGATWAECDAREHLIPEVNLGGGDLSLGLTPVCVSSPGPDAAPDCVIAATPAWKGLDRSYTGE
jgi:hypothetical protein